MICINCFHTKTNVSNSRSLSNGTTTWRRHHCKACHRTFTTYERPYSVIQVINESGSIEMFYKSKLCLSIAKSLDHDKKTQERSVLDLTDTVEQRLFAEMTSPIPLKKLTELTHEVLRRFDEIAGLHYAASHHLIHSIRRRGRPSIASVDLPIQQ